MLPIEVLACVCACRVYPQPFDPRLDKQQIEELDGAQCPVDKPISVHV